MRIPRLYIDQPLAVNQTVNIDSSTFHYISNVLRMKVGRQAILFNGSGGEFKAAISAVDKKSLSFEIQAFNEPKVESRLDVELGCCLIKNDRMDWLLQKATELGVTRFSPLWSDYTDIKIPQDRLSKKCDHWQQVVISACEQSGRTQVPKVNLPQMAGDWIESVKADQKMLLHPYQAEPIRQCSNNMPASIGLLVGPEGGLSEAEVELAHQNQFKSITLGPRILRAETAPLCALSIIQYELGDL